MAFFFRSLCFCVSIGLAGCAHSPSYHGTYDRLGEVPPAFLASYPDGSQQRDLEAVQKVFKLHRKDFHDLYQVRLNQNRLISGQMDIAVALQPSGSVEAVALIASELEDPTFERAMMLQVSRLPFGPAVGEGLYVFWHSLSFTSY